VSADVDLAGAISTLETRLPVLERLWEQSAGELNHLDALVVVVQGASLPGLRKQVADAAAARGVICPVRVVADLGVGVSRSRNAALAAAGTEYVWFLDDDVRLVPGAVARIREFMAGHAADIYCGRVRDPDTACLYKHYREGGILRRLELLRVSSIEMVVAVRVWAAGVSFPERLGLGASLPAGEEAVFLLNACDAGRVTVHMPFPIVEHAAAEDRSFRQAWKSPARAMAQGVVARRVGGVAGVAVLARWGWRMVRVGLPLRQLVPLAQGFMRAGTFL